MQLQKHVNKRFKISIFTLLIGILLYLLFNNGIFEKNNLISNIIRNYLPDMLWIISFFFASITFFKNITQKYIILTSIYVLSIGIIYEVMQKLKIVFGTFDFIDILVYCIAIIIACFIEKNYMEGKNEKEKN